MMKTAWWLAVFATFAGFGALLMLAVLHQHHYTFDPYSWHHLGGASVETRDLWNAQKDLYRWFIVRVFILTSVFAVITVVLTFMQRKLNQNLQ